MNNEKSLQIINMLKRKPIHIDEEQAAVEKPKNWSEQFDKNWYSLLKSAEAIRLVSLVFVLMILTIFFTNYAERQKFHLRKLKAEVEELQHYQKTMEAEFIYSTRESEIEEKLKSTGYTGFIKPVKVLTYSSEEIGL